MRRWLTIAIVAACPRAAHAGGAALELAAGTTPATEAGPGSSWLSNKLAGIWDIDERWQLRLDLSSTRVYTHAADSTPGDVYLGSLSAVYSPDEHWSLRLSGGWSPGDATLATMPVALDGLDDTRPVDARLHAVAASYAFGGGIDYDSATAEMHAPSASLSVGVMLFDADQEVTGMRDPAGAVVDAPGLMMRCHTETCRDAALGMLMPQSVQLGQLAVSASVTDTVDRDTDLSLDASYFMYDQDPLKSGATFALATVVPGTFASASGAPLLRDSVTPSVAHRWGNLSATASVSFSDYVDGHEEDVGASLRVQYKLALAGSHRLKLHAKLAVGSHLDDDQKLTRSGSAALGAQYSW
ncbi:MAG TPA: hypothetical protein VF469_15485 [Kofleriaceae bacterium]